MSFFYPFMDKKFEFKPKTISLSLLTKAKTFDVYSNNNLILTIYFLGFRNISISFVIHKYTEPAFEDLHNTSVPMLKTPC